MITIPRKTESIIPISISQVLNDSDTAVFMLKSGETAILSKEIIQNGDDCVIHLYASDTADVDVGYYRYSIVITKSDETSFSFDGKAYIKENGSSGAFVRGGDVLGSSASGRTDSDFIHTDTAAGWNAQKMLIGKAGHIYVYTDHSAVDGVPVPNIKIGDGKSYLVDNPFISLPLEEALRLHSEDTARHISSDERNTWNGKVCVTYSLKLSDDGKTLTLVGSDGKTSSAAVNSGDSSGRRCRLNTSIDTLH